MAVLELRNGRQIGDNQKPYIVAELNSSHNGKIENAKAMIDSAKECGCDCVKLQSWSADSLYADEYYENNPISKRIVTKLSLSEDQLRELASYCEERKIDFSSTPYSHKEVCFLATETNAPFIKIASMEINNLPFLRYIASKGLPMVLSTGMSTSEEIQMAVKTIESTGNHSLCILHCVSLYPADAAIINLNNMRFLQEKFPDYPVGYSDHTMGYEVAAASVALGAAYIEKHFTLDHKKMGMDNNMATEPDDMKNLVAACHNVHSAMGNRERHLLPGEEEQRIKMRRSLITKRDLYRGEILTVDDMDVKRPGDGISPMYLEDAAGKRLKKDLAKGQLIRWELLEE